MKVALDTNILLYGLRNNDDDNDFVKDSKKILSIQKGNFELFLPTPVIGEYLSNFPESEQEHEYMNLLMSYAVINYDVRTALQVAKIWSREKNQREWSVEYPKSCLKIDIEIMACCINHGMNLLCTNDKHILKISKKHNLTAITPSELLNKLFPQTILHLNTEKNQEKLKNENEQNTSKNTIQFPTK